MKSNETLHRDIFSLFTLCQQQIAVNLEKEKSFSETSLARALLFHSSFTQVILIRDKPLMMRVPVISLVKGGYAT